MPVQGQLEYKASTRVPVIVSGDVLRVRWLSPCYPSGPERLGLATPNCTAYESDIYANECWRAKNLLLTFPAPKARAEPRGI